MEPMLGFVDEDEVLGEARIIKVFQMRGSKPFTIGGSAVEDGKFTRNALCRVLRRGKVRGRMLSLDWQATRSLSDYLFVHLVPFRIQTKFFFILQYSPSIGHQNFGLHRGVTISEVDIVKCP